MKPSPLVGAPVPLAVLGSAELRRDRQALVDELRGRARVDVGLRLAADTTGTVVDNPADRRRLWGPFVPPAGVHTDTGELDY